MTFELFIVTMFVAIGVTFLIWVSAENPNAPTSLMVFMAIMGVFLISAYGFDIGKAENQAEKLDMSCTHSIQLRSPQITTGLIENGNQLQDFMKDAGCKGRVTVNGQKIK